MFSIVVVTLQLEDADQHIKLISSVLDACRGDYEIVVIYSHSSNCPSTQSNVRYYELEPEGIYNAMNFGYKQARFKWVYFSNPGDTLLAIPKRLSEAAILHCFPVNVLSEDGAFIGMRPPKMSGRVMPPHQGMFLNKHLFEKNFQSLPFDEGHRFCGDLDFYLKVSNRCPRDILFHSTPIVSNFKLGGVSNQKKLFLVRKLERIKVLVRHMGIVRGISKWI